MMAYFGASINEQPVISEKTGAEIANGSGIAVKLDSNGNVVKASTAGEAIYGVLIMQTPENVASGDDVTVQFKDIGMVAAGGTFAKGDSLQVDASGKFIKATTGKVACAVALEAGVVGKYVRARICIAPVAPASAG